jgi:hypothetical protein
MAMYLTTGYLSSPTPHQFKVQTGFNSFNSMELLVDACKNLTILQLNRLKPNKPSVQTPRLLRSCAFQWSHANFGSTVNYPVLVNFLFSDPTQIVYPGPGRTPFHQQSRVTALPSFHSRVAVVKGPQQAPANHTSTKFRIALHLLSRISLGVRPPPLFPGGGAIRRGGCRSGCSRFSERAPHAHEAIDISYCLVSLLAISSKC